MSSLEPRTVFVSGASRGLGRAIAQYWLTRGCSVWGSARAESGLVDLMEQNSFNTVIMDLYQRESLLQTFTNAEEQAGGFDLVVNNAGFGVFGELTETPQEEWDGQITAMLGNLIPLIRQQVVLMKHRGSPACLVNVSSLAVEFPLPFMSGYNVVKAGLSALSESLLMELRDTSIRVVDFRPGDYRTQFNNAMRSDNNGESVPSAVERAWAVLEKNLEDAPPPDQAAADLHRAVSFGRTGVVRSGDWFQAVIAPILLRFAPEKLARAVRWRYFDLQ